MTNLPDYLKELEELKKNATPGPWEPELEEDYSVDEPKKYRTGWIKNVIEYKECGSHQAKIRDEDMNFICELRNTIPRILADFKKLQKDKAELIEALINIRDLLNRDLDNSLNVIHYVGEVLDRVRSSGRSEPAGFIKGEME